MLFSRLDGWLYCHSGDGQPSVGRGKFVTKIMGNGYTEEKHREALFMKTASSLVTLAAERGYMPDIEGRIALVSGPKPKMVSMMFYSPGTEKDLLLQILKECRDRFLLEDFWPMLAKPMAPGGRAIASWNFRWEPHELSQPSEDSENSRWAW